MPLKLVIFASGSGSNAQAIIDKAKSGVLDATVTLIFSDRNNARVLERAREAGIPAANLDPGDFPDRSAFDLATLAIARAHGCDAIALAGYMRILSPAFLREFAKPILNVHPALLPAFTGAHGIGDALAYGVKITGVSVHFVTEQLDGGPLIIQAATHISPDDDETSARARLQALEHRVYPQALQWLAKNRLAAKGRETILKRANEPLAKPPADALVWPPLEEGF